MRRGDALASSIIKAIAERGTPALEEITFVLPRLELRCVGRLPTAGPTTCDGRRGRCSCGSWGSGLVVIFI